MHTNCPFTPVDKVIYSTRVKLNSKNLGGFTVGNESNAENMRVSKVVAVGENVEKFKVGDYICTADVQTLRQYFEGVEYLVSVEQHVMATMDKNQVEDNLK